VEHHRVFFDAGHGSMIAFTWRARQRGGSIVRGAGT
jgi:hypothetical protein